MKPSSILILLGGLWHDFDGFAAAITPLFETHGCRVASTYDLDVLEHLDETAYDLILSYTCFSSHRPGFADTGPEGLTDKQVSGLVGWVQRSGALLGAHAATVLGNSDSQLGRLFGGVFVTHPEPFEFTIQPLSGPHPITAGLPAFSVHDEFYIQDYDPSVRIHMVASYQDVTYPMVWSRLEGRGRVAVVAPGHFLAVWQHPVYQRLLLQTAAWLIEK